jgi:hypothetical protein
MRPLRCLAFVLLAASALVCSACEARAQAMPKRSPALAREIAAAKRMGLPVGPKDMAGPSLPTARNAAPIYRQLFQRFETVSSAEKNDVGNLGRAPTAAQVEKTRKVLVRHRDILALIHRAAARPQCVFRRDWSQGPAMRFPEFAGFREAARWIKAESAAQLKDGRPLEAVKTQALGFRIARHAASDPILIGYLVGVAINAITLSGMEHILYTAGGDPAVADAVGQAVEKDFARLSLAHSFRGDLVTYLVYVDIVRKGGPGALKQLAGLTGWEENPSKANVPRPRNWDTLMDANAVYLLRTVRKAAGAADRPYPEFKAVCQEISSDLENKGKNRDLSVLIATIALPMFDNLPLTGAKSQAQAGAVRSGAAVLAWKARHGAFPARLEEALSPAPADPFDLKPLRYRREGDGFVVYSVGPTGKFDGGKPDVKLDAKEALFRYPLPAYFKAATPVNR